MRRWIPATAVLLAAGAVVGALGLGVARLMGTSATPSVQVSVPFNLVGLETQRPPFSVGGQPPPTVALPAQGSMVLETTGAHLATPQPRLLADLDPDHVRPIASVAKAMTALVVVAAHPLGAGESGPVLTMTAADVALYKSAVAANGSNVPVFAGERLSERQLLEGLLVPSGNNLAETLANWVSGGSVDAFVVALNARAAGLGMTHTHFVDASGFDDRTVSTAADLVRLGRAVLDQPALAQIVGMAAITLPDGTTLPNTDALVGHQPGWLGIKTGHDDQAGYCLLFAARLTARNGTSPDDDITYVGAVLAQPPDGAVAAARAAVESAAAGYVAIDAAAVSSGPGIRGTASTAWGGSADLMLGTVLHSERVAVRAGDGLTLRAVAEPAPAPLPAGARVGRAEELFGGRVVATWAIITGAELPGPSFWDRVLGRAG